MLELLNSMAKWLKAAKCNRCDQCFYYVKRVGLCVNEMERAKTQKTFYFIDVWCHRCNETTTYTLRDPMTIREMIEEYSRQFHEESERRRHRTARARQRRQSVKHRKAPAISNEEVQKIKQILAQSENHEDFLRQIGVHENEIRRPHGQDNSTGGGHNGAF